MKCIRLTVSTQKNKINVYENDSDNKIYKDTVRGFAEYLVQTSEIQTSEKHKQAIEIATQEAVQMMSTKIQSNIFKKKYLFLKKDRKSVV